MWGSTQQEDMLSEQWGWSDDVGYASDQAGDSFDGAVDDAFDWLGQTLGLATQYETFKSAQNGQANTLNAVESQQQVGAKPVNYQQRQGVSLSNDNMLLMALLALAVVVVVK